MVIFWLRRGRNRAMRDATAPVAEEGEFDRDRLSNARGANAADHAGGVAGMKCR